MSDKVGGAKAQSDDTMKWLMSRQTRELIVKRIKQFFTTLVVLYLIIALILVIFGNMTYGKTHPLKAAVQKGSGIFHMYTE